MEQAEREAQDLSVLTKEERKEKEKDKAEEDTMLAFTLYMCRLNLFRLRFQGKYSSRANSYAFDIRYPKKGTKDKEIFIPMTCTDPGRGATKRRKVLLYL